MKIRIPAGVRVDGRSIAGRSLDVLTVVETTDDTGRALLLDVALRELERADRAEAKALRAHDRKPTAANVRAFSDAALRVDDWAAVVERITGKFADEDEEEEEEEEEEERRESVAERIERQHDAEMDFLEASAFEWEFSCEYLAGESSSNVDVNFRLRRIDGRRFGVDEAQTAMSAFRENISAGHMRAPRGYRIAGIDWRNPSKSLDWTGSGEFPGDLGGLESPLYIASDHPSLWRLGGVDD